MNFYERISTIVWTHRLCLYQKHAIYKLLNKKINPRIAIKIFRGNPTAFETNQSIIPYLVAKYVIDSDHTWRMFSKTATKPQNIIITKLKCRTRYWPPLGINKRNLLCFLVFCRLLQITQKSCFFVIKIRCEQFSTPWNRCQV